MDVLKCLKLNKEFRTDGVSLHVDEAIKLFYRNFLQLNV